MPDETHMHSVQGSHFHYFSRDTYLFNKSKRFQEQSVLLCLLLYDQIQPCMIWSAFGENSSVNFNKNSNLWQKQYY